MASGCLRDSADEEDRQTSGLLGEDKISGWVQYEMMKDCRITC